MYAYRHILLIVLTITGMPIAKAACVMTGDATGAVPSGSAITDRTL